ncbi:hypothetical protein FPZ12_033220 [Amycolatopsis acidicola]|uniref:Uncharacterized protein n=1 Tax=Amycolatopsis acidicola TaxID=2596893 RepID=A0A5N0UR88_9PSEU|nr:hypothetical protein [Amycolatopsis acidicola]KAA9153986.1 hypothetical protein FPZ12_033220 [Amycolatopsis acidicola]
MSLLVLVVAIVATGKGSNLPTAAVLVVALVILVPSVVIDVLVFFSPKPRNLDTLSSYTRKRKEPEEVDDARPDPDRPFDG